jgi:hypothetical protein
MVALAPELADAHPLVMQLPPSIFDALAFCLALGDGAVAVRDGAVHLGLSAEFLDALQPR